MNPLKSHEDIPTRYAAPNRLLPNCTLGFSGTGAPPWFIEETVFQMEETMRRARWLLLILVFALVAAACSSDSDDTTTTGADAGGSTETTAGSTNEYTSVDV
jgi:hypothetical protein